MSGLVESTNYTDYWRELTDTICKLVQLTRPITLKRHKQFLEKNGPISNPLESQIKKVLEESFEVVFAESEGNHEHFCEELLDLLFAGTSTIHVSEISDSDIKFAVGFCLAKFQKRGWLF